MFNILNTQYLVDTVGQSDFAQILIREIKYVCLLALLGKCEIFLDFCTLNFEVYFEKK